MSDGEEVEEGVLEAVREEEGVWEDEKEEEGVLDWDAGRGGGRLGRRDAC